MEKILYILRHNEKVRFTEGDLFESFYPGIILG